MYKDPKANSIALFFSPDRNDPDICAFRGSKREDQNEGGYDQRLKVDETLLAGSNLFSFSVYIELDREDRMLAATNES